MSNMILTLTDRDVERFWAKVKVGEEHECWLWTGSVNPGGYGTFRLKCSRSKVSAHRVAWFIAHGHIPEGVGYHGTCVCHSCDTTSCVNPRHPFLGSQQENIRDMAAKRRGRRWSRPDTLQHGEACPFSKLTEQQVREIHALYRSGLGATAIARRFPVRRESVRAIIAGRNWKHVTPLPSPDHL